MAERKANQFKEKTIEGPEEKSSPKERIKSERKKLNLFPGLRAVIQDEKFIKLCGLTSLLASVYLLVAFTSFFFTSEIDQGEGFNNVSTVLFNNDARAENWLGKLGAIISELFINDGFGIASFIFVLFTLVIGFRLLFKISYIPISKTILNGFFFLNWISITCGFIFHSQYLFLGGKFGFHVNHWLQAILGYTGTGILLLFSILAYSIITFNINFSKITPKSVEPEEKVEETEEEKEIAVSIQNLLVTEKKNGIKPAATKTAPVYKEEEITEELLNEEDFKLEIRPQEQEKTIDLDEVVNNIISTHQPAASPSDIQFEVEQVKEEITEEVIEPTDKVALFGEYDPTLDLSSYQFPTIELLEKHGNDTIVVNNEELQANKNKILDTLANYNIQIEKIKATIGPTVTLYEIVPAAGVRISKIKNLEDDIALSLSALGIRIIAPIPGKGTIGIEVPNQNPEVVSMRSIIASEKFQHSPMELPIALGKTISNETFIADLAKMPHLLMAGATGQGKSVGLNAILVSLLYKKHPAQVKFVLVDPKKVELTLFNTIERHFLAKLPDSAEAIITDTKKVIHTLNSLCIEMDNRYELLKNAQVRNLKEYNAKFISRKLNPNEGHHFLPYIVLVVDEFADLIMTAGKEVEMPIARLAQLARAIGIHLIIATQRPSVNIITGTIKANFPARIAFRVTSKIDSRTILDSGGADQLIGRGDMLLSTGNDLIRIQCAFVDTPEVEKITEFIGSQRGYPNAFLLPEYIDETASSGGGEDFDAADRDALFDEAARIIVQHQQGSASLLQRRLKLGYNRAGRIIDQLEAAGIIGPFEGSKAREVLIKDPMSLEQFLTNKEKL